MIRVPVDREYLEYDADAEELQIGALAFGEAGFADDFVTQVGVAVAVKDTSHKGEMVALTVSSSEKTTGSYTVQNALGATMTMRKMTLTTKAIFDKRIQLQRWQQPGVLFPLAEIEPHLVGLLPASVEVAKRLKASLQLAIFVVPRAPYVVRSTSRSQRATFRSPVERTDALEVMVADIQCGFALDANGKVLGAYPTN